MVAFEGSDKGAPAPVESAKSSLNLANIVQQNEAEKSGVPARAEHMMTPAQMADSIIKNNGFGQGGDRDRITSSLGTALTGALKNEQDGPQKLVDKVNKDLAEKGSSLRMDDVFSGGGGGGGGKKGLVESHRDTEGAFLITDDKSHHVKDALPMEASYDRVQNNGKLVGERTEVNSENGGSGGGWGKQPSFQLHDMKIHDDSKSAAEHGIGGSKGGISPMTDTPASGGGGGGKGGGSHSAAEPGSPKSDR